MNYLDTFIESIQKEDLIEVKSQFKKEFLVARHRYGTYTALHMACMFNIEGHIVKFLLSQGFNIEEPEAAFGYRPIHLAAKDGKVNILKTLIDEGCSVKSLTKMGETALDVAIKCKRENCITLLKDLETITLPIAESGIVRHKIEGPPFDLTLLKLGDDELIESLHNSLKNYYVSVFINNTPFPLYITPFIINVIIEFNDQYINIFGRIKRKEMLNTREKYLINSLTYAVSLTSRCQHLIQKDAEIIINSIINYLNLLSEAILPNITAARMDHLILYSLCNLIKSYHFTLPNKDNVWSILWRFFTIFHNIGSLKLSSGFVLLFLHNKDKIFHKQRKDINNIREYIRDIIERNKDLDKYLEFPIRELIQLIE